MQSNRRPFTIESKGRRPFKAPKWSHQQELDALKGKHIGLLFTDDERTNGKLLEADAFSLKLEHPEQTTVIFFKHVIAGFWEVK